MAMRVLLKWFGITAVLVGVGVIIIRIVMPSFAGMTIRRVIVQSDIPIKYGLESLSTKNILFLDAEQLKEYILKRNPLFLSLIIEKQYPDTILIRTEVRKPVAVAVRGTFQWPVDADGMVLSGLSPVPAGLPTIEATYIPLYTRGSPDWRLKRAVNYIKELNDEIITTEQIRFDPTLEAYILTLASKETVTVPVTMQPDAFAASLQLIISRFRIEGKELESIDFRYEKPVVRQMSGQKNSPR